MADQEIVYYQEGNITITNARAILGSKTYAMANITSVSMHEIAQSVLPTVIVGLIGAVTALCSFSSSFQINSGVIIGLILIGLAGYSLFTAKPSYAVRIGSASGETNALTSRDKEYIQNIVKAVNQAIVKRG